MGGEGSKKCATDVLKSRTRITLAFHFLPFQGHANTSRIDKNRGDKKGEATTAGGGSGGDRYGWLAHGGVNKAGREDRVRFYFKS